MWIKFLAKNWQYIVIALLVGTNYLTFNWYLDKRDDLTKCTISYEAKKAEIEAANGKLGDQNDAIDALKLRDDALRKEIAKLSGEFSDIDNKYNKAVDKINNTEVPKSCEGSMKWLVDQGKKL